MKCPGYLLWEDNINIDLQDDLPYAEWVNPGYSYYFKNLFRILSCAVSISFNADIDPF